MSELVTCAISEETPPVVDGPARTQELQQWQTHAMGRRTGKPDALTAELAELAKGKGEEKEKPKISLGDGAALKRALDDAAAVGII